MIRPRTIKLRLEIGLSLLFLSAFATGFISSTRRHPADAAYTFPQPIIRTTTPLMGKTNFKHPCPCVAFSSVSNTDAPDDGDRVGIFGLSLNSPQGAVFASLAATIAVTRPIRRHDLVFSVLYPAYLCLANQFRFDRNSPSFMAKKETLPLLREGRGPWFKRYVTSFGAAGIILPLVAQLLCPNAVADVGAPHLYLTLCQVAMEVFTKRFYALPRIFVPIGFNAYRLGVLLTWLRTAYDQYSSRSQLIGWELFGFLLALGNTVVWYYNLFVFLLLRALPQYLNREEFPDAEVVWRGQLFPVLAKEGKKSS